MDKIINEIEISTTRKWFATYWQILENSSRNFSFPGRELDRFPENSPINFLRVFSCCKISGMS